MLFLIFYEFPISMRIHICNHILIRGKFHGCNARKGRENIFYQELKLYYKPIKYFFAKLFFITSLILLSCTECIKSTHVVSSYQRLSLSSSLLNITTVKKKITKLPYNYCITVARGNLFIFNSERWIYCIMECIERNSALVRNIPGRASCRKINLRSLSGINPDFHRSEPRSLFGSNINRSCTDPFTRWEPDCRYTRVHSRWHTGAHALSPTLCKVQRCRQFRV